MAAKDLTSAVMLGFIVCNVIGFSMIVGFFSGTGTMHAGIEPCVHLVTAEASKCVTARFQMESEALTKCIKELDEYVVANPGGHWFKILLPVLIVSLCNILVFSAFWYMRAVKQVRGRDALSAEQQYKMGTKGPGLTEQGDYPPADQQEAYPQIDAKLEEAEL